MEKEEQRRSQWHIEELIYFRSSATRKSVERANATIGNIGNIGTK
jgi:hypothetical protein